MHKFRFEDSSDEYVEMACGDHMTIDSVLEVFQRYLKACGFVFSGELEVVKESDFLGDDDSFEDDSDDIPDRSELINIINNKDLEITTLKQFLSDKDAEINTLYGMLFSRNDAKKTR